MTKHITWRYGIVRALDYFQTIRPGELAGGRGPCRTTMEVSVFRTGATGRAPAGGILFGR
jgi:hypothetical protein